MKNNPLSLSLTRWLMITVIFAIAQWQIAANELRPYRDFWKGTIMSAFMNPDGTEEQTIQGAGWGTFMGKMTIVLKLKTSLPYYESSIHSMIIPFHGVNTDTASDGSSFDAEFRGITVIPLTPGFMPLPPPYAILGEYSIVAGTGRFANVSGSGQFVGMNEGNGKLTIVDHGKIAF